MTGNRRGHIVLPADSTDDSLNRYRISHAVSSVWWTMIGAVSALVIIFSAVTAGYHVWGNRVTQGHISIGLQLAPTNLDIRNTSGSVLDQLLIGNVYEALLCRNSDNSVSPGIAQSWDVSDDRRTYTFHIRHAVTFSNGDPLNAHDVVWSIQTMMNDKLQGSRGMMNFQSIRATDDHTVVLQLTEPFSELLWNLSGRSGLVFDRHAQYDPKTQAIGSGPFVIESYTPNVSVQLQARNNYWGEHKPSTQKFTIRYYSDPQSAINALMSGDVQVLAPVSPNLMKSIKDDPRFQVAIGKGTDKYVLAFNNAHGVLTNKKIRQAIRYAIDNNALIASRGYTDASLAGPIPSLDPGYEDLSDLYPLDLQRARDLMAQAGYGPNDPLHLTLTYANTYPAEIGQQLRSQLQRIGIDLDVQRTEFAVWLSRVYRQHDFEISLVDHNESHDFYQWANPQYYYGYNNTEVQKLYVQAMQARTDSQRDRLLAQAARIVSQDAAADWLFNFQVVTAWDKNVEGFPLNMNQTFMPLWKVSMR